MGAIYLDPIGMDTTAGHIGEHANELRTLASTLESACSAVVPVSLAGWLAEELGGIAVQAHIVVLTYTVAAIDTALRARQIQGDQSLVAAQPALAAPSIGLGAALAMGSVVGNTGDAFEIVDPSGTPVDLGARLAEAGSTIGSPSAYLDVSTTGAAELGAVLTAAGERVGGTPTAAQQPLIARLLTSQAGAHSISVWNAPDGLSFVSPGRFEDAHGRLGALSEAHRDPRTGDVRFGA